MPVPVAALTPDEQAVYNSYINVAERGRYVASRVLARAALAWAEQVAPSAVVFARKCTTCGSQTHGKPYAEGMDVNISISHAHQVVAFAMSRTAKIGIDIEYHSSDQNLLDSAESVLADSEHPRRDAKDLYTYWCRKEAVVKATGDGLVVPLNEVVVSGADQPAELIAFQGDSPGWWLHDLDVLPRYSGAVCGIEPGPVHVTLHDGEAVVSAIFKVS